MNLSFLYHLILLFALFSCIQKKNSPDSHGSQHVSINIKYAEGFKVTSLDYGKLVEVIRPYQGSADSYKYLLIEKGIKPPDNHSGITVIQVPISSIVCTSTTHIPLLDYIDESEALIGFPTTDYISSEKMRKRIDLGQVAELGIDKGMDLEKIAVLKPNLVMGYTMTAEVGQLKKIEELGIPVVLNAEYLEKHPLGRAEWIKFMALFFTKEAEADSVFNSIEQSYLETQQKVLSISNKPSVLSGVVYGDTWFLPGGKNYAAKLLADAGCNYLWSDNDSNGSLELSFESVYEKAWQANLWIGVASFKTLNEIEITDKRYTKFKAFQNGDVYTYDIRKGSKGGSEFLELGYLRPDIILKDLVKISHPELLPDHELFFHRRLK